LIDQYLMMWILFHKQAEVFPINGRSLIGVDAWASDLQGDVRDALPGRRPLFQRLDRVVDVGVAGRPCDRRVSVPATDRFPPVKSDVFGILPSPYLGILN
jgi:hypothetical protein